MRVSLSMRSISLVFGILSLALGGCGTSGLGTRLQASFLEKSTAPAQAPLGVARPSLEPNSASRPGIEHAAVTAESRTDAAGAGTRGPGEAATAATSSGFTPVSVEPLPPGQGTYLLAAADPATSTAPTVVAQRRGPPEPPPDVQIEEYDPWEPYNEKMFRFNQTFDRYVLKPVAKGYNVVMPDLFQQMIGNGFDNINVVPKLANNLLQWNLKGFGIEAK